MADAPVEHRDDGLDAGLDCAEPAPDVAEPVLDAVQPALDAGEPALNLRQPSRVVALRGGYRLQQAALRALLGLDVADVPVHGGSQDCLGLHSLLRRSRRASNL